MSLDLDAIRARADAATKGPWRVYYFGGRGYPQRISSDDAFIVAETHEGGGYPARNAEFMAHAREDVPALLAEVARHRRRADDAEDQLRRIDSHHALIGRLADELQDISEATCWRGNFNGCDNGGCTARRELIAEAREALADAPAEPSGTEDSRGD